MMMYVRYPLSLRNVEDLLAERGIDISHETVRFWWNRFGPMFAAEIRKRRVADMRGYPQWRWHSAVGSTIGLRIRIRISATLTGDAALSKSEDAAEIQLERNPFRLCRGLGVRRGHIRRP